MHAPGHLQCIARCMHARASFVATIFGAACMAAPKIVRISPRNKIGLCGIHI